MLFLILVAYVICAVISFGYVFALWQRCWPSIANETKVSDFKISIFYAIMWPISVPVIMLHFVGQEGWYKGFKFDLKDEEK